LHLGLKYSTFRARLADMRTFRDFARTAKVGREPLSRARLGRELSKSRRRCGVVVNEAICHGTHRQTRPPVHVPFNMAKPLSLISHNPRGESPLSNPSFTMLFRAHCAALRQRRLSGLLANGW